MVSTISGRIRRLMPMIALAVALAAGLALPAAPAATQSATPAGWIAFAITADFSGAAPKIEYTVIFAESGPPIKIVKWDTDEITGDCTFTDIKYSGGYAIFNGTSSKITCEVPALADKVAELFPDWPALEVCLTCMAGEAPVWASADIVHDRAVGSNPIVDARALGMIFAAPSNGLAARTRVELSSGAFHSGTWAPSGSGNRLLMGMNGPGIIAIDNQFHWLSYLDPAWRTPFSTLVGPNRMGHWYEAPSAGTRVPGPAVYELFTTAGTVSFGYDAQSNEYFDGKMRFVRIDPGCPGF